MNVVKSSTLFAVDTTVVSVARSSVIGVVTWKFLDRLWDIQVRKYSCIVRGFNHQISCLLGRAFSSTLYIVYLLVRVKISGLRSLKISSFS